VLCLWPHLIGGIVQLLPYIVPSIFQLEAEGLGLRLDENKGQRGRFQVKRVECYHPFTEQRQTIYQEGNMRVDVPVITTQPQEHLARAARLSKDQITLHFVTPLRLIYHGHLITCATFSPFMHRLLERYFALECYYGRQELALSREDKIAWLQQADKIQCSSDQTHWQELKSYSNRQKRTTPVSGLIGSATFVGDLQPFLELLVLGELIHVGKDAVKGNGRYKIIFTDP
jgi:hypothetical protein